MSSYSIDNKTRCSLLAVRVANYFFISWGPADHFSFLLLGPQLFVSMAPRGPGPQKLRCPWDTGLQIKFGPCSSLLRNNCVSAWLLLWWWAMEIHAEAFQLLHSARLLRKWSHFYIWFALYKGRDIECCLNYLIVWCIALLIFLSILINSLIGIEVALRGSFDCVSASPHRQLITPSK